MTGIMMPDKSLISSSLFALFSDMEKKEIIKIGKRLEFFEKKCLFQRGDSGNNFFIIRKGEVTISIMSDDGREIILSKMSDGDAFGEIAMFDQGLRTADAYVATGTVLIEIGRDDFFAFLDRRPSLYKATIQLLCNRLRWCSELLEDFLFQDILERLLFRLIKMAEKYGSNTNVVLEVTQDELAKMSGASREGINRSLQLLQDKGLLYLQRKRIIIPDVTQLKNLQKRKKDGVAVYGMAQKSGRKS